MPQVVSNPADSLAVCVPTRRRPISTVKLRLGLIAIIVAAAGLYLLANGRVSLWDRDEPRYAQCSREMLEGMPGPAAAPALGHPADWVVPYYLGKWRIEKPPFIYWAQATAMRVFGVGAFAARFPSSLAMTAVLILMGIVVWLSAGPRRALWTVLILSGNALAVAGAKMCITDAMLLLWITLAQVCLYAIWRGSRSWKMTIIFWLAVALAGLTKGPIVLAVLLATMVALGALDYASAHARRHLAGKNPTKDSRATHIFKKIRGLFVAVFAGSARSAGTWWIRTRPLVGVLILTAVAAPWLILLHHRAPGFIRGLVSIASRHVGTSMEQHSGPPGYYLALCLATFFPWGLFLITAGTIAWKHRNLPQIRFALAALLGPWIFQEIMRTKLPFYVLPTFPPLAFLTADALIRCFRGQHDDLMRPIFIRAVLIWTVAIILLGLSPWVLALPRFGLPDQPWRAMTILSVFSAVYGVVVFGLFRTRRFAPAAATMGIGGMILFALVFGLYLPNARFLRMPNQLADVLIRQGATHPGDAVMAGFKEPSLAFYQGGTLREGQNDQYLTATPPAQWPQWLVLPRVEWARTKQPLRDHFEVIADVRGINYAGKVSGERIPDVLVLKQKKQP